MSESEEKSDERPDKVRYTTYVDPRDLELLKKFSDVTGLPTCFWINVSVEDFFEKVDPQIIEKRHFPPVDKNWCREKLNEIQEDK